MNTTPTVTLPRRKRAFDFPSAVPEAPKVRHYTDKNEGNPEERWIIVWSGKPIMGEGKQELLGAMRCEMGTLQGEHTATHTRKELNGWPKYREFAGPMWDGCNGVRYEDWETNRHMSI